MGTRTGAGSRSSLAAVRPPALSLSPRVLIDLWSFTCFMPLSSPCPCCAIACLALLCGRSAGCLAVFILDARVQDDRVCGTASSGSRCVKWGMNEKHKRVRRLHGYKVAATTGDTGGVSNGHRRACTTARAVN